ncbi:uncharacterized protein LOC34623015 [Cyclospora cayetanensis]|uniref:Uncharacterized protein LOC34623015 n=1 Tax=Cyclospora cayetanensis TaxID=88456 RepID=A0A6P6RTJ4_9EIME|nr:uncharacterized protein LOC34623015 [Cyclospora cayetanensis]
MALWLRDSEASECYRCGVSFSALIRRHHCRQCGLIFCWRCCSLCRESRGPHAEGALKLCLACLFQKKRQIRLLTPLCQQQQDLDAMTEWMQHAWESSTGGPIHDSGCLDTPNPMVPLPPPADAGETSRCSHTNSQERLSGASREACPNGLHAMRLLRESVSAHCMLEGIPAAAVTVLLHLVVRAISAVQLPPSAARSLGDAVYICCTRGEDIRQSHTLSGLAVPLMLQHKQQQQLLPMRKARLLLLAGNLDMQRKWGFKDFPGASVPVLQGGPLGGPGGPPSDEGFARLEVEKRRRSLALQVLQRQLALLQPDVLLLSGGVSQSLSIYLASLRVVVIPGVSVANLVRASRAIGAPLWASLEVATTSLLKNEKALGWCSVEWGPPAPGASAHLILSDCPPFRLCTICLVLPPSADAARAAAKASVALAAEPLTAVAAAAAAGAAAQERAAQRYKRVLWRALWTAFGLQQQLKFVAACCYPGNHRLWAPLKDGKQACDDDTDTAIKQLQRPNSVFCRAIAGDNRLENIAAVLKKEFRGQTLVQWLRSCGSSLGSRSPMDLVRRLLQCMYTETHPRQSSKEPSNAPAVAAAAAGNHGNVAGSTQLQFLMLVDAADSPKGSDGPPRVSQEDLCFPDHLRVTPPGRLCCSAEAPQQYEDANSAAFGADGAEPGDADSTWSRLLEEAFLLEAQRPSYEISWSCRLQHCSSGYAGAPSPPCVLSFNPFGATLGEVLCSWTRFILQQPGARRCPAGDARCKRPLSEHTLAFSRDTNRVLITFTEGLPAHPGGPSHVSSPILRCSRIDGSPSLSSGLPDAAGASARAAAPSNPVSPHAPRAAAASSEASSSPASKDLDAATTASGVHKGACTGGSAQCATWWQTCSRCGGSPLAPPEEIGRFGDIPFVQLLELLLTDETLRGDGTCSGTLILQKQQGLQLQGQLAAGTESWIPSGCSHLGMSCKHQSRRLYSICRQGGSHLLLTPVAGGPPDCDPTLSSDEDAAEGPPVAARRLGKAVVGSPQGAPHLGPLDCSAGATPSGGFCCLEKAIQRTFEAALNAVRDRKASCRHAICDSFLAAAAAAMEGAAALASWARRGVDFLLVSAAAVQQQLVAVDMQEGVVTQSGSFAASSTPSASPALPSSADSPARHPPGDVAWELWTVLSKLLLTLRRELGVLQEELQQAAATLTLFWCSLQQVVEAHAGPQNQQEHGGCCERQPSCSASRGQHERSPANAVQARRKCGCWWAAQRLLQVCDFSWNSLERIFRQRFTAILRSFSFAAEAALQESSLPNASACLPRPSANDTTVCERASSSVGLAGGLAGEGQALELRGFVVLESTARLCAGKAFPLTRRAAERPKGSDAGGVAPAAASTAPPVNKAPAWQESSRYLSPAMQGGHQQLQSVQEAPTAAVQACRFATNGLRTTSPTAVSGAGAEASPRCQQQRSISCEVVWRLRRREEVLKSSARMNTRALSPMRLRDGEEAASRPVARSPAPQVVEGSGSSGATIGGAEGSRKKRVSATAQAAPKAVHFSRSSISGTAAAMEPFDGSLREGPWRPLKLGALRASAPVQPTLRGGVHDTAVREPWLHAVDSFFGGVREEADCLQHLHQVTREAVRALEASLSSVLEEARVIDPSAQEGLHGCLNSQEAGDAGSLIAAAILSRHAALQLQRRWATDFSNVCGGCCGGFCGRCTRASTGSKSPEAESTTSLKACKCCQGTCPGALHRARSRAAALGSNTGMRRLQDGGLLGSGGCAHGCFLLPSALRSLLSDQAEGLLKDHEASECLPKRKSGAELPAFAVSAPARDGDGEVPVPHTDASAEAVGLQQGDCFSCCLFVPPLCSAQWPVARGAEPTGRRPRLVALSSEDDLERVRLGGGGPFESTNRPVAALSQVQSAKEDSLLVLRDVLEAPTDGTDPHIVVQQLGRDRSHTVTLFFAPQFHALRHLLCSDDLQFCCSIKRTRPVKLYGGKSGASFSISSDGLYILKEINRHELKLLLAQGDAFFRRFSGALYGSRPSALTALFGLFQLTTTASTEKKYFVAMRNLRFREGGHPKGPVKVFDLKGLGWQRYVPDKEATTCSTTRSSGDSASTRNKGADAVVTSLGVAATGRNAQAAGTAMPAERTGTSMGPIAEEQTGSCAASGSSLGAPGGREKTRIQSDETPCLALPATLACALSASGASSVAVSEATAVVAAGEAPESSSAQAALEGVPVLWDQNLREYSGGFALCLIPPDNTTLMAALKEDLELLQRLEVVDYSLLVVLYEETGELCFGLIDFFRRYTWDKQVENIGKSIAYMTSGLQPTVLSPADYRQRFAEALGGFFTAAVPAAPFPPRESFAALIKGLSRSSSTSKAKEDNAADAAVHVAAPRYGRPGVTKEQIERPRGTPATNADLASAVFTLTAGFPVLKDELPLRTASNSPPRNRAPSPAAYFRSIILDQQLRDSGGNIPWPPPVQEEKAQPPQQVYAHRKSEESVLNR